MHNHVIIFNFIGLLPSKKYLAKWINNKWNPKSSYDLKLGSKVFFTVIINHPDDYITAFEGGPYLFNVVGLYMRPWRKRVSLQIGRTLEKP